MKDLRQRLLATFRVEYAEHAARIRELLSTFEARGGVFAGSELDETFRRAHSLKGAARAVDLRDLEGLAHRLEAVLAGVRDGTMTLPFTTIRIIHHVLDTTDDLMAALSRGEPAPDTSAALAALDGLFISDSASRSVPKTSSQIGENLGAMPPSPTSAESEIPPPHAASTNVSTVGGDETVRIPVAVLDRLLRLTGLLHSESAHRETLHREALEFEERLLGLERRMGRLRSLLEVSHKSTTREAASTAITQHARELDTEVRELAQRQRELRRSRGQSDWTLRQLDQQLQEHVHLARLIPAETVFGGFRQMARDLAKDLGREIEFRVRGLEVQADRSVLQELKDPVMHLIRNAIDHGVEPPLERLKQGKAREGLISLDLSTGGGRLQITLSDDGRGIDLKQVRATGVRRRLITEQQAEALSREELLRLILQPGFSTAAFVTDVSGRGMGLSVVAEALSRLQGKIEILPSGTIGTTLRLTAPLSLSTMALLVVEADGQRFGLPSAAISQLLHIPMCDVQTLEGNPIATVKEQALPLASLRHLLGLGSGESHADFERLPVVVTQARTGPVGLVVDSFVSHTQSLLEDLGPVFAGYPHLLGAVREASGEVIPALNLTVLLERSQQSEGAGVFKIVLPEKREAPHILVVDDSMTTRTLEKSVLEAHGYRVRVAVDGLEALGLLQEEAGDLVIADVEMPRMDGFGLLAAIRRDVRLKSLPVIIVTSLEKREHRERGLALGADAYIVKRHFDQSDLLETIQRLL